MGLDAGLRLMALGHVVAVLLARMNDLHFARHPVPDEDPVQRTESNVEAPLGQRPTQPRDRQVGLVSRLPEDLLSALFDPVRLTVTAQCLGIGVVLRGCPPALPADVFSHPANTRTRRSEERGIKDNRARFPGAPAAAGPPRDYERTGRSAVAKRGSRSCVRLR